VCHSVLLPLTLTLTRTPPVTMPASSSSDSDDEESVARLQQLNSVIETIVPTQFYVPVSKTSTASDQRRQQHQGDDGAGGDDDDERGAPETLAPFQLKLAKVLTSSIEKHLDCADVSSLAWERRLARRERRRKRSRTSEDDNDNKDNDNASADVTPSTGVRLFSWGSRVAAFIEPEPLAQPAAAAARQPHKRRRIEDDLQHRLANEKHELELEERLAQAAIDVEPTLDTTSLPPSLPCSGVVFDPCLSRRESHGRYHIDDYAGRPIRRPSQWLKPPDWKPYRAPPRVIVGQMASSKGTKAAAKRFERNRTFLAHGSASRTKPAPTSSPSSSSKPTQPAPSKPATTSSSNPSQSAPSTAAPASSSKPTPSAPSKPATTPSSKPIQSAQSAPSKPATMTISAAPPQARKKTKYKNLALLQTQRPSS